MPHRGSATRPPQGRGALRERVPRIPRPRGLACRRFWKLQPLSGTPTLLLLRRRRRVAGLCWCPRLRVPVPRWSPFPRPGGRRRAPPFPGIQRGQTAFGRRGTALHHCGHTPKLSACTPDKVLLQVASPELLAHTPDKELLQWPVPSSQHVSQLSARQIESCSKGAVKGSQHVRQLSARQTKSSYNGQSPRALSPSVKMPVPSSQHTRQTKSSCKWPVPSSQHARQIEIS
jgi:hypothetical protein